MEMGSPACLLSESTEKYFSGCLQGLPSAARHIVSGPGPGWVDKCVPNFTPLTNNIQACGWLLLKSQALESPRSATTKRDPRSQMGP